MAYYFLMASLPSLAWNAPAPQPFAAFRERCAQQISPRDLAAVDAVGAGESEFVLLVQGSSARQTEATDGKPVDCTIVAIIDYVERGGKLVFEKSKDKGFPVKG